MPIDLHPGARARLVEVLASALVDARVRNNCFLDAETSKRLIATNGVLPDHGSIREYLEEVVSENPCSDFFESEIRLDLYLREYVQGDDSVLLSSLDDFSDLNEKADEYVSRLTSLPWRYTFSFKLPDWMTDVVDVDEKFSISPNIQVVHVGSSILETFPIDPSKKSIPTGKLFTEQTAEFVGAQLMLELNGYVDRYYFSNICVRAVEQFRAFCGVSLVEAAMSFKRNYSSALKNLVYIVHSEKDGIWRHHGLEHLPHQLSRAVLNLFPLYDDVVTNREKTRKYLSDVSKVFSSGNKASKLILSGQWFFDGYASDNDLLSFIQTMVCLEILLGDKSESNKIGLGELLKNRCAYLIGRDQADRNDILNSFPEIYSVRSSIVHGGKNKLTAKEHSLFSLLRSYCRRTMYRERELL